MSTSGGCAASVQVFSKETNGSVGAPSSVRLDHQHAAILLALGFRCVGRVLSLVSVEAPGAEFVLVQPLLAGQQGEDKLGLHEVLLQAGPRGTRIQRHGLLAVPDETKGDHRVNRRLPPLY
jgi:hypothetical protein